MRIDGDRPNPDAAVGRHEKIERGADTPRETLAPKPITGDRVALSPNVALAHAAVAAAHEVPEIRHEFVERMRSLLEAGELGADPARLADSLIDAMLGRK